MAQITISVYQNKNPKLKAYGKFYGRVKHSTTIDVKTLCAHTAKDSGIEEAEVVTVFDAVLKQIEEQLCNGHPIKVEGLGTMKVGVSSKGVSEQDVKKKYPKFDPATEDICKYLSARQVKSAKFLFTPCEEIKTMLRGVKFQTDKSEWADYMNQQETETGENEGEDNNG